MKISDIEEIYNYICNNYEYGKMIVYSKERTLHDLQYHTLYWAYVRNKYNRKVSKISSEFYDLTQSSKILQNKKKLFVINTSTRSYSNAIFNIEKMMLEKLFPIKTKYELDVKNENLLVDSQKIIDSIIYSIIKELYNIIDSNSKKYLTEIKITKPKKKYEEYKKILQEEIIFLKNQCFWQEITNIFLVSFFVLMIVYRYFTKKIRIKI